MHFNLPIEGKENILSDPEVIANIYCKSRNLPNTDTQTDSTHVDKQYFTWT